MPYPQRLIPNEGSVLINDLDNDHILCRGVRGDIPLKDEMGMLSALAVEEVRIPGYSTNKIPPSKIEDIKLSFNSNELARTRWNEGEAGYQVKDDEFIIVDNRQFFLFRIGDIQGYTSKFPYPYSGNQADYKCEFTLMVVHAPLIANYSHCEFAFVFLKENGEEFEKPSRKSFKIINACARQKLIEISKFELSSF